MMSMMSILDNLFSFFFSKFDALSVVLCTKCSRRESEREMNKREKRAPKFKRERGCGTCTYVLVNALKS